MNHELIAQIDEDIAFADFLQAKCAECVGAAIDYKDKFHQTCRQVGNEEHYSDVAELVDPILDAILELKDSFEARGRRLRSKRAVESDR